MARPKGKKREKEWPLIRKRASTPGKPWMVDCGLRNGKRVRFAFATKEEAEGKATLLRAQRKGEGEEAFTLAKFDRVDVEAALEVLKPHGFTLLEAAEFYVRHAAIVKEEKSVSTVLEELLSRKAQDGRSKRYQKDLRLKLGKTGFSLEFGPRSIHEITSKELDDWLRARAEWSAITRNNYSTALGVLFSFAVKRGYCLSNPTDRLERASVVPEKPGILSLAEAKALLESGSDFTAAIALGLFAGLRPEAELWNLDWRAIDLKERLIDISVSKNSASHRFVKISENLAKWLKPYLKDSGPVCPKGDAYHSRLQKVRSLAAEKLSEANLPHPSLTDWPQDAMRHTFASIHYARFKHAAETAEQMGHAGGLRIFFRHYRNRVKETDARAFWRFQPSSSLPDRASRP
jgi:integrase